jgi:hypothetical protein
MKFKLSFFTFLLALFFLIYLGSKNHNLGVEGVYVNTNYNYKRVLPEIPHSADTLVLKSDMTFSSKYFGLGTYTVEKKSFKSIVRLEYPFGNSKARISFQVKNKEGRLALILYEPNKHYYLQMTNIMIE